MLADRTKRKKYCLNPQGNFWKNDKNKFGQKLLEKMGWKEGEGLGAKNQGIVERLRVPFKFNNNGLGFKESEESLRQGKEYLALLSNLNGESVEAIDKTKVNSLEAKSKHSKARVHYQKFTRGKDLSRYSAKDLLGILGIPQDTEDELMSEINVRIPKDLKMNKSELLLSESSNQLSGERLEKGHKNNENNGEDDHFINDHEELHVALVSKPIEAKEIIVSKSAKRKLELKLGKNTCCYENNDGLGVDDTSFKAIETYEEPVTNDDSSKFTNVENYSGNSKKSKNRDRKEKASMENNEHYEEQKTVENNEELEEIEHVNNHENSKKSKKREKREKTFTKGDEFHEEQKTDGHNEGLKEFEDVNNYENSKKSKKRDKKVKTLMESNEHYEEQKTDENNELKDMADVNKHENNSKKSKKRDKKEKALMKSNEPHEEQKTVENNEELEKIEDANYYENSKKSKKRDKKVKILMEMNEPYEEQKNENNEELKVIADVNNHDNSKKSKKRKKKEKKELSESNEPYEELKTDEHNEELKEIKDVNNDENPKKSKKRDKKVKPLMESNEPYEEQKTDEHNKELESIADVNNHKNSKKFNKFGQRDGISSIVTDTLASREVIKAKKRGNDDESSLNELCENNDHLHQDQVWYDDSLNHSKNAIKTKKRKLEDEGALHIPNKKDIINRKSSDTSSNAQFVNQNRFSALSRRSQTENEDKGTPNENCFTGSNLPNISGYGCENFQNK